MADDSQSVRANALRRIYDVTSECRISTFGIVGNGKSSVCNSILDCVCNGSWARGTERFKEDWSADGVTMAARTASVTDRLSGLTMTATDTCGLFDNQGAEFDTERMREFAILNTERDTGYHGILYTVPIDKRVDISEIAAMDVLSGLYGEEVVNHVIIVITRGDIPGMTTAAEKRMQGEISTHVETALGVSSIRSVVVTNNSDARTAGGRNRSECFSVLLGELATLIVNNPKAFKPRPVTMERLNQVMGEVKRKHKGVDLDKVFKAIITIVPIIGGTLGGRCSLL